MLPDYSRTPLEEALRDAVAVAEPMLFWDVAAWAVVAAERRGTPRDATLADLRGLAEAGTPEAAVVAWTLARLESPECAAPSHGPLRDEASAYVEALLAGDHDEAESIVARAVVDGVPLPSIYVHVFQAALVEIGARWQRDEITVADEHAATAATERIMGALFQAAKPQRTRERGIVVLSADGTRHALGARMVADLFALDGWPTSFLGADAPAEDVVAFVARRKPAVVGISATVARDVVPVKDLIAAIRAAIDPAPTIVVGGRAFAIAPTLWGSTGADAYAATADSALELARAIHG